MNQHPHPYQPPHLCVQLPSKESLTLEELSQAWKFLSDLQSQPFLPLLPSNLKRLQPEDWEAVGYLLHRELEHKQHRQVH